jgi:DNA-binding HxlR family transcriptional regulator
VSLSASANRVVGYITTLQENNLLVAGVTIKPKISKIRMKTLNEHRDSTPISIDEATLNQGLRELIKEGFLEGTENENSQLRYVSVTEKGKSKLIIERDGNRT